MLTPQLRSFAFGDESIEIYVPDINDVLKYYHHNKDAAYWAKVWPASVALCNFLQQNKQLIQNKSVLELAAGLGLAGLYVAGFSKHIMITDIEPLAIGFIQQSIKHCQLRNANCVVLDWDDAYKLEVPDVVLLSDVNYEPTKFEELLQLINYLLQQKIAVIISTPQRLVDKYFIMELLPYCGIQSNTEVMLNDVETSVSIYVLTNTNIKGQENEKLYL